LYESTRRNIPAEGCHLHGNQPSGFIKREESIDNVSESQRGRMILVNGGSSIGWSLPGKAPRIAHHRVCIGLLVQCEANFYRSPITFCRYVGGKST
jgi:hypothetical protein